MKRNRLQLSNEEFYRKQKILYGTRTKADSVQVAANLSSIHNKEDLKKSEKKKTFSEKLIISYDSRCKAIFDIWIVLLVGYSCPTSMFYVAFSLPTSEF